MSRRFIAATSIGIIAALAIPVAALAMHEGPTAATSQATVTVHSNDDSHGGATEDRSCRAERSGPTTALATVSADQSIRVQVPDVAMLKVDAKGKVLAAATNTGCTPRNGDLVYLYAANGTVTQSTTFHLGDRRWTGDFRTPGVFQAQATRGSTQSHDD
ncbi:MAG: hypothetical protein WCI74_15065 [Actinomycetes bacterium]